MFSSRHLVIERTYEANLKRVIITLQPETKALLGIVLNRDIELPRQGAKFFRRQTHKIIRFVSGSSDVLHQFHKTLNDRDNIYPLFRTIPVADKTNQDGFLPPFLKSMTKGHIMW